MHLIPTKIPPPNLQKTRNLRRIRKIRKRNRPKNNPKLNQRTTRSQPTIPKQLILPVRMNQQMIRYQTFSNHLMMMSMTMNPTKNLILSQINRKKNLKTRQMKALKVRILVRMMTMKPLRILSKKT